MPAAPDRPEAGDAAVARRAAGLGDLATAELHPLGYLAGATNSTLLCELGEPGSERLAVYKPRDGERPLWDFPEGTLCQREVAAHVVGRALGWDLVPATVLRDGPFGEGSVQRFVPHDPQRHYFVLVEGARYRPELARMALFDLLVNNTDRKGSHVLESDEDGRLYGIDHGVCFHPQPKLRTVIWELGGTALHAAWQDDLRRLAGTLTTTASPLRAELCELLTAREIELTARRAERLAETHRLPRVPEHRRPYPWPPL